MLDIADLRQEPGRIGLLSEMICFKEGIFTLQVTFILIRHLVSILKGKK